MSFSDDFTAIDIELSNPDWASICEIGVARFRGGQLVETWRSLINPESGFGSQFHSELHGIHSSHVLLAPTFPDIYSTLQRYMDQELCIFHGSNNFDQGCISRACSRYSLDDLTQYAQWYSTLDMAREHWPDEESYKLEKLAHKIGHDYHPHNALEDAIAAAAVYRAISRVVRVPAIAAAGKASDRPRTFRRVPSRRREKGLAGNPDGPFANTFIVLSGTFSPPWDDRAGFEVYLAKLGFVPRGSISGKTQILVTGESPGPSKLKKAEQQNIRIMCETEFLAYIEEKVKL